MTELETGRSPKTSPQLYMMGGGKVLKYTYLTDWRLSRRDEAYHAYTPAIELWQCATVEMEMRLEEDSSAKQLITFYR